MALQIGERHGLLGARSFHRLCVSCCLRRKRSSSATAAQGGAIRCSFRKVTVSRGDLRLEEVCGRRLFLNIASSSHDIHAGANHHHSCGLKGLGNAHGSRGKVYLIELPNVRIPVALPTSAQRRPPEQRFALWSHEGGVRPYSASNDELRAPECWRNFVRRIAERLTKAERLPSATAARASTPGDTLFSALGRDVEILGEVTAR